MSLAQLAWPAALAWATLSAVPYLWWWRRRRAPDVWAHFPLPVGVVSPQGRLTAVTPDADPADLAPSAAGTPGTTGGWMLPAVGTRVVAEAANGRRVAAAGLPGGGAVVVAVPAAAAAADLRDRRLADTGAKLAHELNNPLTAVAGHLQLIATTPGLPEAARVSAGVALDHVRRIETLSSGLRTLTGLTEANRRVTRCDLRLVVEEGALVCADLADELGADLVVDAVGPAVPVVVDPDQISRAVANLVTNALRHGHPPGIPARVRVSLVQGADTATVVITDSGPGLSGTELTALAQPLVRGPAAGPGTGLGLTIVTEILGGHAACLAVLDPAGGGPGVCFTLPLPGPARRPAPAGGAGPAANLTAATPGRPATTARGPA